ncbi:MAG: DUF1697 domain-containing protein [Actinobacteria bacterium]|nr:DUF1697 domain-containing protein [Actinomycetota bacterium]
MQAVAFLRGINVGGHDVRNVQLEELFGQLDLERPTGFLASGNVLFGTDRTDTTALERDIAPHLEANLGFAVPTFVRTGDQVAAIAQAQPFADLAGKVHVAFLRTEPDSDLQGELHEAATESDRLTFDGREVFWHVAGRFMDSALSGNEVNRLLGSEWTVRTLNTVTRLAGKLDGPS